MIKTPFLFRVDEEILQKTKEESIEKGISINTLFNLKLMGLEIIKKTKGDIKQISN